MSLPKKQAATNPVRLRDNQVDHVHRINDVIWQEFAFAIDTSVMGSGKTHTSYFLAQHHNFRHIVVVCPATVEDTWKRWGAYYGVNLSIVSSYEGLRSTTGSQPKHGLLDRFDVAGGAIFTPTRKFRNMVTDGCLLIADEFQRVKNKTVQHSALKALATHLCANSESSRMLLLSGTPMDKREQVVHYMQLLGVIKSKLLYRQSQEMGFEYRDYGLGEYIDFCKNIDPEKTGDILKDCPPSRDGTRELTYRLYVELLQDRMVSSMPPPNIDSELTCYNGYYHLSESAEKDLLEAIGRLHKVLRYDPKNESINVVMSSSIHSMLTPALRKIETSKLEIWIRKARDVLETIPGSKVVLAFNYMDSVEVTKEALAEYNPIVLVGSVKKEKRAALIDQFQHHNTNHRVIIGNIHVMCEGIDLDDTEGSFPRYALASPNYHVMRGHQFTHRFHRSNTKSEAKVCFVYGKVAAEETSILNALARKTDVMKDTLKMQSDHGILFPGEYSKVIEGEYGQAATVIPNPKAYSPVSSPEPVEGKYNTSHGKIAPTITVK